MSISLKVFLLIGWHDGLPSIRNQSSYSNLPGHQKISDYSFK